MNDLYELKEKLCKKLEEYARKGEITASNLDVIDKLAHAVKNVSKVIEMSDDGYSGMRRQPSYRGNGRSYGKHDSVREMAMSLGEMMGDLPDELRGDAERFMRKLDSMM